MTLKPIGKILSKLAGLTPEDVSRRVAKKAAAAARRLADCARPTYLTHTALNKPESLPQGDKDLPRGTGNGMQQVVGLNMEHRFDLLGSGWKRCAHQEADGQVSRTVARINRTNREEARKIWRKVDPAYVPIDWQVDLKSGYRWSEGTWYREVCFGDVAGVDVKLPWELARMQHLPQMARVFGTSDDPAQRRRICDEFRHQVLDFVGSNPPRFGVNWVCSMDVAIRAVNMLVAYDMFKVFGATFEQDLGRHLARTAAEHGRHIMANLEWHHHARGNHYLANVVGVLFTAAHLPQSEETDRWLTFGVRELIKEVGYQFNPDGTSFEGSTYYHRLSAEMVVYGTALILGLPKERLPATEAVFPEWFVDRLERMGDFVSWLIGPDGEMPQIGDNDSGRLLKLSPTYSRTTVGTARRQYANLADCDEMGEDEEYLFERGLDSRHLLAALSAVVERDDWLSVADTSHFERAAVTWLAGGKTLRRRVRGHRPAESIGVAEGLDRLIEEAKSRAAGLVQSYVFRGPGPDLLLGLERKRFADFGLVVFRSERLLLTVRCGPVGQNGIGGHSHNDVLSVTLTIDGQPRVVDPGTFVYTPHPKQRNRYRSVHAHFAPQLVDGSEPGDLSQGIFLLPGKWRTRCVHFAQEGFVGTHRGFGQLVGRAVRLRHDAIEIVDYTAGPSPLKRLELDEDSCWAGSVPYSPGYGIQQAEL